MEQENIQTVKQEDEEISLIDLLSVLLKHLKLIIGLPFLAAIGILIFAIVSIVMPPEKSPLPNLYTPTAYMLINDESSSSGGLSSLINSSGLGGLASLAGVSTSVGSSYSSLALFLTKSNTFLDAVVDEFGLIERWEIEEHPRFESRKHLKEVLNANFDEDSGVFSLSFTDYDPVFAQKVVNFSVDYIEKLFLELGIDKNLLEKRNLEESITSSYNEIIRLQKEIQNLEHSVSYSISSNNVPSIMLDTTMLKLELTAQEQVYTQLKTQLEMLKISMMSEKPVFQILEKAEVPDRKSEPSRGMLCIIVVFAAFFIAVFLAFLLNAIENIKKDEVSMKKLSVWRKKDKK